MSEKQSIEQLKLINDKITVLNQKRTQYIGAMESLKEQQKELKEIIEKDYGMSVEDLEKHIATEKEKIAKEESEIIKEFEELYSNEEVKSIIQIQPPFTLESIYQEIQSNLFNYKSKVEAEIEALTKQQEEIKSTLKEEYGVEIQKIDKELEKLSSKLSELQINIQKMYEDIISDEQIKALIES